MHFISKGNVAVLYPKFPLPLLPGMRPVNWHSFPLIGHILLK